MKTAITTCQMLIRVTGLLQILLGVTFWTGNALNLIPVHMFIGLVLVLSLWILAVLAARTGVKPGLVALAAVWGAIVLALGVTQTQLLPGAAHWVIQVLHLVVGLAAMGLGERLARMSKLRVQHNTGAVGPASPKPGKAL
jgi:hypothetical protein